MLLLSHIKFSLSRYEVVVYEGKSRSYLTINEVTIGDDAKFECKNPADYFTKDSVQLTVTEPGKCEYWFKLTNHLNNHPTFVKKRLPKGCDPNQYFDP